MYPIQLQVFQINNNLHILNWTTFIYNNNNNNIFSRSQLKRDTKLQYEITCDGKRS